MTVGSRYQRSQWIVTFYLDVFSDVLALRGGIKDNKCEILPLPCFQNLIDSEDGIMNVLYSPLRSFSL